MTITKSVAKVRISREIADAEIALNDALIKQSMLFTTLVSARRDNEVSNLSGQDALLRLTKSQHSLLSAGSDLARVHGRLLEINRELGDASQDCPDDWRNFKDSDDVRVA